MISLLFTVALVAALVAYARIKKAPAEERRKAALRATLYGAVGLVLLLAVAGKLNPVFAVLAGLVPVAIRLLSTWNLVTGFLDRRSARCNSEVRSRHLSVAIDPRTGKMEGRILCGPFEGRRLDDLDETEILRLLTHYGSQDPESEALLEAFLDQRPIGRRRRSGNRHHEFGQATGRRSGMSVDEASRVLGVPRDASPEAIVAAHKRLIQKFHPDRGGSAYLATKINVARETLLSRS